MVEKVCKSCGLSLPVNKAGRPSEYCSTGCRRAAEFEIRRVNRRLESLETSLSSMRINPRDALTDMIEGRTHAERVAAVQAELDLLKARFRVLLDDSGLP